MMRPATPNDTHALLALTAETGFFKPLEVDTLHHVMSDYFELNQAEGERCFIREDDGTIIGFVFYAPEPMTEGSWSLWWIVVRPGMQSKGIGRELLQFVEDDIRGHGARVLWVETSGLEHYEPTRRFYLKNGYEVEATLRDYYAADDHQVLFRKRF